MGEITTYEIPTKIVGHRDLWEGDVKTCKVDIYWDSHGKKIYDDPNDSDPRFPPHLSVTFKKCHVKLVAEVREYFYDSPQAYTSEFWRMYVDGSEFTDGMVQGYKYLPKSGILKIDAPWGAG